MADIPAPANDRFAKPVMGVDPILSGLFWAIILYAVLYCAWVALSALLGLLGVAI